MIGELDERARELFTQLRDEATGLGNRAAEATSDFERRVTELRESLQGAQERLEFAAARAGESTTTLEHFSSRLGQLHEQALVGFHTQLDDVLSLHRNELHRRSESLFEELASRVRARFDEASQHAALDFDERIAALVAPQILRTEEAVHRMAGGRSLLDAAISLQQDRITTVADEAFAESLSRFRENLGSAEQLLDEASRGVTSRNLTELEEKVNDLKHQAIQDVFKSAEWYEKKAQTHIQNMTEKAGEQAGASLREKAGEISSVFTSELDNSSRNFLGHTQSQMEDAVRDAFERARGVIQRSIGNHLGGFYGRNSADRKAGAGRIRRRTAEVRDAGPAPIWKRHAVSCRSGSLGAGRVSAALPGSDEQGAGVWRERCE